jgi:hypothetical protein
VIDVDGASPILRAAACGEPDRERRRLARGDEPAGIERAEMERALVEHAVARAGVARRIGSPGVAGPVRSCVTPARVGRCGVAAGVERR